MSVPAKRYHYFVPVAKVDAINAELQQKGTFGPNFFSVPIEAEGLLMTRTTHVACSVALKSEERKILWDVLRNHQADEDTVEEKGKDFSFESCEERNGLKRKVLKDLERLMQQQPLNDKPDRLGASKDEKA